MNLLARHVQSASFAGTIQIMMSLFQTLSRFTELAFSA